MKKRLFDLIFSLVLFVLLSPLMILIYILIFFYMGYPVIYKGERIGYKGQKFRILKFRTMIQNADSQGNFCTALHDSRLTNLGKILRKYKLDELPQLLNIIKGEMSVVGPRPQVEKYTNLYTNDEKRILSVKPGMTDYASIQFINLDCLLVGNDVEEKYKNEIEPIKNKLRLKYVNEKSFITDMKIIFLTIIKIVKINKLWNT